MTKEEKQRLEEIKEDLMIVRSYQDASQDEDVIMSLEKIAKLLRQERHIIKLRKPYE